MALFPYHSRVNVWGRGTDLQCKRADLLRFPAILSPQLTGGCMFPSGGPLRPCLGIVKITFAIARLHKPDLETEARPRVKRGRGRGGLQD